MSKAFAENLGTLRREKELSQREAASGLGISQALLSHYENGAREPGLDFVVRVCDYYGVSADFLLGRADRQQGSHAAVAGNIRAMAEKLREIADNAEHLAEECSK